MKTARLMCPIVRVAVSACCKNVEGRVSWDVDFSIVVSQDMRSPGSCMLRNDVGGRE